eukprot:g5999.t1
MGPVLAPAAASSATPEMAQQTATFLRSAAFGEKCTSTAYHVSVPARGYHLLANLVTQNSAQDPQLQSSSRRSVVLYLHGFPAQSVDHRRDSSHHGAISERFAGKLAEHFCSSPPNGGNANAKSPMSFCCFNFGGTPGSDSPTFRFADKTVRQELTDTIAMIAWLTSSQMGFQAVHVVGLSTGAIIGSLLRGELQLRLVENRGTIKDKVKSITVVAGCGGHGMRTALEFDFDKHQLEEFEKNGYCWKDFWLPVNSKSNPPEAELCVEGLADVSSDETDCPQYARHRMKLKRAYMDDFLELSVPIAVSRSPGACPLFVIHGGLDEAVPVYDRTSW